MSDADHHRVENVFLQLAVPVLRFDVPLARAREVRSLLHRKDRGLREAEAGTGRLLTAARRANSPQIRMSQVGRRGGDQGKRPHIEADVLRQLEVVRVAPEVVHDEGVVHVVGVVCRDGEVTETHHLLGGVDDDGVVDAGSVGLRILLQQQAGGRRVTLAASRST